MRDLAFSRLLVSREQLSIFSTRHSVFYIFLIIGRQLDVALAQCCQQRFQRDRYQGKIVVEELESLLVGSTIFYGIRDQTFYRFWDQGSKFGVRK